MHINYSKYKYNYEKREMFLVYDFVKNIQILKIMLQRKCKISEF